VSTDDLVAFIEARLADDQRMALAATPEHWSVEPWRNDHNVEFLVIADYHQGPPAIALKSEADAAHIARHDPSRVLRDVEALRAVVEECKSTMDWVEELRREGDEALAYRAHVGSLLLVLKMFAAVWREHPDFRPEWSPDA
jgi:hypothetical protein